MSVKFSISFMTRLKLHHEAAYKLAIAAGLNPSALSLMVNGGRKIDPKDPRLQQLGRLLGVPSDEMFESSEENGRTSK